MGSSVYERLHGIYCTFTMHSLTCSFTCCFACSFSGLFTCSFTCSSACLITRFLTLSDTLSYFYPVLDFCYSSHLSLYFLLYLLFFLLQNLLLCLISTLSSTCYFIRLLYHSTYQLAFPFAKLCPITCQPNEKSATCTFFA